MDWEKDPRSEWQLLEAMRPSASETALVPRGPTELLTLQKLATQGFVELRDDVGWFITEGGMAHLSEAPPALLWNGGAAQHEASPAAAESKE